MADKDQEKKNINNASEKEEITKEKTSHKKNEKESSQTTSKNASKKTKNKSEVKEEKLKKTSDESKNKESSDKTDTPKNKVSKNEQKNSDSTSKGSFSSTTKKDQQKSSKKKVSHEDTKNLDKNNSKKKEVNIKTTLTPSTEEVKSKKNSKKPQENVLVRSYKENKKAWRDTLIVVGALALFGVGFGIGHVTTGNNPTIAVISKGHGANHKVKQQDIDHQLNNTHYAHSIANQQLTLKVLATLYPKQYDKYTQKAQKYIKAQQRTYGGAKNYQQVLAANNSSEADVINNYLLTQMITVSVMHHNQPSKADLEKLYKKADNNAYTLSGVLVRTKDQANAVLEGIHNGSSYTSMKNKINKNDFAYFNRSTPDMKNSMTLQELNDLDTNLANGVSQMKKGETAIIKNGSKNYFVITLKNKDKQSFKESKSRLKTKYINNLMLNGYGPIQKALKDDYKRAGVKVKDTKQFGDIVKVQNFYSNNGFNNPNAN